MVSARVDPGYNLWLYQAYMPFTQQLRLVACLLALALVAVNLQSFINIVVQAIVVATSDWFMFNIQADLPIIWATIFIVRPVAEVVTVTECAQDGYGAVVSSIRAAAFFPSCTVRTLQV